MRTPLLLLLVSWQVVAQVPLPEPPFLPQNASAGASPSSGGIPNPQWSSLLGNLLYFYEAQRSGKLPSAKRVKWRNDSALTDGQDVKLDLTGGYYDADYIKCTFPLSFTVMSICWGATDFGKGYDLANQTPYLDDMLRWSLNWLIKAHAANNTLFVQIANGENPYWGGDQGIPLPRPSYQINDTSPGTDAAAGTAAAFAACSNLYANRIFSNSYSGPATLQNTTYAATLLEHAQQLFTFATSASGGLRVYQDSVPEAGKAYASSGYGDELAMAALFLSWATNSSSLYQQAQGYWQQYSLSNYNGVFNWDDKTPGLPVLFAQIAQANPSFGGNASTWQTVAEKYFDGIVYSGGPGYQTHGGLLYYDGDSKDASLNPALNAAMLLTRYVPLASTQSKKNDYWNYAKAQVSYALGNNPMQAPYIVGTNPNSPQNPHSALASGGNNISNINTYPAQEAYILYGAVVGGPDKYDRFFDIRGDWPETEAALDYNAPMLTLAAMHVLNDTADPFYTSLKAGAYDSKKPQGMPCDDVYTEGCGGPQLSEGGQIALGAILGLTGLAIFSLLAWWGMLSLKGQHELLY
ncbi:hypothetical protein AZE42_00902 [Rhizopogon vesiculosus]|uniref:Endoglucanase n=1 Tax=Rhizopogon vesiculosus TaxID=180088 RepID=A0A1J8RAI9_9AGAM|nr:hypothetical protein AZE42_00902 [Rhizopogon vesiculosus]